MGMSASQARLLSLTARLSNNEMAQQSVAYSKQRLADNSEQANNEYLEALNKTKYQVLTGYNGNQANYEDLTYASITGNQSVACSKQYIVKTNTGKILVSQQVANAFKKYNGDYNRFLAEFGYTQTDIEVDKNSKAIHEAWDRYLFSVGKGIYDSNGKVCYKEDNEINDEYEGEHILNFGFTTFEDGGAFNGYAVFGTAIATNINSSKAFSLQQDDDGYYKERTLLTTKTNEDGSVDVGYFSKDETTFTKVDNVSYDNDTKEFIYNDGEQENKTTVLYYDTDDNSLSTSAKNRLTLNSDTNNYLSEGGVAYSIYSETHALNFEGTTQEQRELYDYALSLTATAYDSSSTSDLKFDPQALTYYKNIFNEMRTCGYTTLEESYKQKLSTTKSGENMTSENKIFNDSNWMVRQLKAGNLTLSYYSVAEKRFISTTMDDDESITEREDSAAIKIAEQTYQKHMDKIEHQDKQFDLQLTKLESEHNAIQTEYDSVKKVISQNVEKSFNVFNA